MTGARLGGATVELRRDCLRMGPLPHKARKRCVKHAFCYLGGPRGVRGVTRDGALTVPIQRDGFPFFRGCGGA